MRNAKLAFLMILCVLWVGCMSGEELPTATVDATAEPMDTATASTESTVTPTVAATPRPTDTPTPTDTPIPVITLPYTQQIPEGAVARIGMGYIMEAALSSDGQYLAVSTYVGTFLYDTDTYQEVWSKGDISYSLKFSPDSRLLASRGGDSIALWEVETGELLQSFETNFVAFSPDSSRLAYGAGNSVVIWDILSGTAETSLVEHSDKVKAAVFVTDDLLATGGEDRRVVLWNLTSGEVVRVLEGHEGTVYPMDISPGGQILVTGTDNRTVLWNALTGEKLVTIDDLCSNATFSPDGNLLASINEDRIAQIRDVGSGQLLLQLDTLEEVMNVTFSPDGYLFVSSRQASAIHKIDPATGETVLVLDGFATSVVSVDFTADGTQLLMAGSGLGETYVRLIDLESEQIVFEQSGFTEEDIWDAAISPDGNLAAVGLRESEESAKEVVFLWNTSTGELISTFPGYWASVEFSPDGRWLAYNSTNGTITLWDVVTRQPILEIKETGGGPVFSPDGKTLAAASIVLYSLPDGDILQRFESSPVTARAFSPDGTYLAAGLWPESRDDDAPIIIWDIASGQPIRELQGHRDDILSLDFSLNGELLASASYGQAFLWDVETGQKLKILDHYSVTSVDFSPDGTLLATGSSDGTVIIWPVE